MLPSFSAISLPMRGSLNLAPTAELAAPLFTGLAQRRFVHVRSVHPTSSIVDKAGRKGTLINRVATIDNSLDAFGVKPLSTPVHFSYRLTGTDLGRYQQQESRLAKCAERDTTAFRRDHS